MHITVSSVPCDLPKGSTVRDALAAAGLNVRNVLGVRTPTGILELGDELQEDIELEPLTLQDAEGRRIYERSLRFVMLMAIRDLFPGQRVRIEHSVPGGIFVLLPGKVLTNEDVEAIEARMREITRKDLPFEPSFWPQAQVMAYYAERGETDKLELLRHRKAPVIRMYCCDGYHEYFHGVMAPSTSWTPIFHLLLLGEGFVILLPNEKRPDKPAAYFDRPKHLAVFSQSEAWCRILGVSNVSDLRRLIDNHEMREFIRVNEALHDQAMVDTARQIVEKRKHIVLVAGPSSSGKTTFAGRLAIQLRVHGHRAYRISLDNYYLDRYLVPKEPDGTYDLEHIRALDVPLIKQQMAELLEGKQVELPVFNFKTQRRESEGIPLKLGPSDILIFEGIHALNPMLTEGVDDAEIYRVFVSALTCLNLDDHNRSGPPMSACSGALSVTSSSAVYRRKKHWACGPVCGAVKTPGFSRSRKKPTPFSIQRSTMNSRSLPTTQGKSCARFSLLPKAISSPCTSGRFCITFLRLIPPSSMRFRRSRCFANSSADAQSMKHKNPARFTRAGFLPAFRRFFRSLPEWTPPVLR